MSTPGRFAVELPMEAVVRLYDHATMQRGRALVGSEDYRFWDEIATALLAAMVP